MAKKDIKTKNLINQLSQGEIAIIDHSDLDQIAAESIIQAKVKLVINASSSISGRYPNPGPEILLKAGIPILDQVGKECFNSLPDLGEIEIRNSCIYYNGVLIGKGEELTLKKNKF